MHASDLRQLAEMKNRIDEFRTGSLALGELVSGLESLRDALSDAPEEWLASFNSEWGTLEEIYSLTVVRNRDLTTSDRRDVNLAADRLSALVERAIRAGADFGRS